jgi:hypothetical protein
LHQQQEALMQGSWQHDDPRAMLMSARVPLAVVLAAGGILLIAPQMKDLLAAIGDDRRSAFAFHLAALAWGFSTWYWSRTVLVALHGDAVRHAPAAAGRVFRLLPRVILSFAFAVLLVMLLRGGGGRSIAFNEAIFVVLWGSLLLVVIYRTRIFPGRDVAQIEPVPPAPFRDWVSTLPERLGTLLRAAPGGPFVAAPLLVLAPLGFAWAIARDPVGFAGDFPGAAAALVGLAMMVPVATVAIALLDQWDIPVLRRFPALVAAIVGLVLVDTRLVARHEVRTLADSAPIGPEQRASLASAIDLWLDTCAPKDGPVQPVVVAAAGGASRAALWTTTVLAHLERELALHRNLFAISAVSGGALGAAVHLGLREEARLGCTTAEAPDGLAARAERIIGRDFLGPPLAAYLFQDSWQLFTGLGQVLIARLRGEPPSAWLVGDRASALEDAFAAAWDDEWLAGSAARGRFDRPFLAAWYATGWLDPRLPLLFQNGAEVASGRRIITAPVLLAPGAPQMDRGTRVGEFAAATDLLGLAGSDVRLSTSVTNSARFPYLTPAGIIQGPNGKVTQVVDGGYVDNLGIRTAREVATALVAAGTRRGRAVRPIIVAITPHGEQSLAPDAVPRCANHGVSAAAETTTGRESELFAPLAGLVGTRAGHGALAIEDARAAFCPNAADPTQRFFHFYLPARCTSDGSVVRCDDVPLNWTLSERMRKHILGQMRDEEFNRREARLLAATLGR